MCELNAKEPTFEYIWGPKPRLMVICVRKVGFDVCRVKGVWRWLRGHPVSIRLSSISITASCWSTLQVCEGTRSE